MTDADHEEIAQGRKDLAAAFRLAARFGYAEGIGNHFSFAVRKDGSRFLINPWGIHFSQIRARDLLLTNTDGSVLEGTATLGKSARFLHAPLHANLPHARCVVHTHMPYATALTTVTGGRLQPIHQNSARFVGLIATYDEFRGMVLNQDEGQRVCAAFGDCTVLFMAHHGVTILGRTVAEAFDTMFYLEWACKNQVLSLSTGLPLKTMPEETAQRTAQQWAEIAWAGEDHFRAMKRILDREEPEYAT